MEIDRTTVPDARLTIMLDESERFDIKHDAASPRYKENGAPLNVWALRARVDLLTGDVNVEARGYLRNRDGNVGERDRSKFLEPDQIPVEAKHAIAAEVRRIRQEIAATGTLKGVTFS